MLKNWTKALEENLRHICDPNTAKAGDNSLDTFKKGIHASSMAATALDYKILGTRVAIEGYATHKVIESGALQGSTWLKKMKNLNNVVRADKYVDTVGNFEKIVGTELKMGLGFTDDVAKGVQTTSRVATTASTAWSHLGYLGAASSILTGYSTYAERVEKYGNGVAVRDAVVHTGIAATSTIIGSIIGTAIPIPVVGTLLGAWAGAALGNLLATTYDEAMYDKIDPSDYIDFWKPW